MKHLRTLADIDDLPKPTVLPAAFKQDKDLREITRLISQTPIKREPVYFDRAQTSSLNTGYGSYPTSLLQAKGSDNLKAFNSLPRTAIR